MKMELRMMVWNFTKLPCQIEFLNPKPMGGNKITFEGCCSMRTCTGAVVIETIEEGRKLRLSWISHNEKVRHEQKARITGDMKIRIIEMLEHASPVVVRSKLVNQNTDETDESCSIVPYLKNLYQMKYRAKKERFHAAVNPIVSILELRAHPLYYHCIHEVQYYPFSCFYSTQLQQAFSLAESERRRSAISIDATGISVTLPPECEISAKTGKTKRAMLYNIVFHGIKRNKAVFQMVTQTHTSIQIGRMLRSFMELQHRQKAPREVFIDESPALLLACVEIFTTFKCVNDYLNHCSECLLSKKPSTTTFIRIDRSHLVKSVLRNLQFRKLNELKKIFYRRVIGLLIQISDFEEVVRIMHETFRCLHEPYLQPNDEDRRRLLNRISTHESVIDWEQSIEDLGEPNDSMADDPRTQTDKHGFPRFVKNISAKYRQERVNEDELFDALKEGNANTLHAPEIESELIDILSKLPLYGNIMCTIFGSIVLTPSSSATEASFRVLKRNVFKGDNQLRIDTWLQKHLDYILASLEGCEVRDEEELGSEEEQFAKASDRSSDEQVCDFLWSMSENLRRRSSATKPEEKSASNKPDTNSDESANPDPFGPSTKQDVWKTINKTGGEKHAPLQRCQNSILNPDAWTASIPVLSNGYTSNAQNKINGKVVTTSMTCAFDSLFHFYMACYVDIPQFKVVIDNATGTFVDLIKLANSKGVCDPVYELRNLLLHQYFTEDLPRKESKRALVGSSEKVLSINCFMSVSRTLQFIADRQPELHTMTQTTTCCSCSNVIVDKFLNDVPMDMNGVQIELMNWHFKRSEWKTKAKCDVCGDEVEALVKRIPNDIIAIESETFLLECDFEKNTTHFVHVHISRIPSQISYADKWFNLKGVVHYVTSQKHFVVFVRRKTIWRRYDDLKLLPKTAQPKTLKPVMLLYVRDFAHKDKPGTPIPTNISSSVVSVGKQLESY